MNQPTVNCLYSGVGLLLLTILSCHLPLILYAKVKHIRLFGVAAEILCYSGEGLLLMSRPSLSHSDLKLVLNQSPTGPFAEQNLNFCEQFPVSVSPRATNSMLIHSIVRTPAAYPG